MSAIRSLTSMVLVLGLTGMFSGYALAGGNPDNQAMDEMSTSRSQQGEIAGDIPGTDANLRRVSRLMGQRVKSSEGNIVGSIYDVVLTPELDSISYVVLSRGGLFGIGRELHAIPWSALRTGFGGDYYVPVTEEQLSGTRGFRGNQWPSSPERGWLPGESPDQFEYRGATAEESREIQNRRASRILGTHMRNPQGRNVATIRDLVVEIDNGQVLYTIASTGGFLGFGNQYAAIPPQAIEFWPDQRVARLNVSEDVLQANAFSPNQWPDLSDETYAQNIRQAFDVEPDGVALGYVPPERDTGVTPSPSRTTEPERMAAPSEDHEAFSSANLKTIDGVVTDVGVFRPAEGGPETLRLRLKTNEGRLVTVHLAPRDYISRQDFYVVTGDNITVKGAESRIGQQSVLMAAEVTREGQTLRLRDANGRPMWPPSGGTAGSMSEPSIGSGQTSEYGTQHHGTDRSM